jgi:hypothetical protein
MRPLPCVGSTVLQRQPGIRSEELAPVQAARVAIWRLFEEGYVDEDMATAGLLAVDLGTRRTQRRASQPNRVRDLRRNVA